MAAREAEQRIIDKLRELAGKGRGMTFDARELGTLLHQPELATYQPTAPWEVHPMTDHQKAFLKKKGVKIRGLKRGEAKRLIDLFNERYQAGMATPKQVAALTLHGITDAHQLTFKEAGAALDAAGHPSRRNWQQQAANSTLN